MIVGEEAGIDLVLRSQQYLAGLKTVDGQTTSSGKVAERVFLRMEKDSNQAAAMYNVLGDESKKLSSDQKILESAINRLTKSGFSAQSPEVLALVADYKKLKSANSEVEHSQSTLKQSFADLRDVMQGPVAAAKAVWQALKQVVQVGSDLYMEYADSERGLTVFNQAMKESQNLSNGGSIALKKYAEELENLTGLDTEDTLALMGNLAIRGRSVQQIKDLSEAAANYAAGAGLDFKTALEQLNGTYQGSARGLDRQNAAIKALTKEQLINGDAVKIINEQYKDMAKITGEDALGASVKLNNNAKQLQEALGHIIATNFKPLVENMANAAKEAADIIEAKANISDVISAGMKASTAAIYKAFDDQKAEVDRLEGVYIASTNYTLQYKLAKGKENLAKLKMLQDAAMQREFQAGIKNGEQLQKEKEQAAIDAEKLAQEEIKRQQTVSEQEAKRVESNIIFQNAYAQIVKNRAIEEMKTESDKQFARAELYDEWQRMNADVLVGEEQLTDEQKALRKQIEMTSLAAVDANSAESQAIGKTVAELNAQAAALALVTEEQNKLNAEQAGHMAMASSMEGIYKGMASAMGEAIVSGADGWKILGNAAKSAIAGIIEAMAAENAILAGQQWAKVFALDLTALPGAIKASSEVALAYAAAGAVRAIPMADGGAGTTTRPTLFMTSENGQAEDFAFSPRSKGGLGGSSRSITIIQNIAGSVITERQADARARNAIAKATRGF